MAKKEIKTNKSYKKGLFHIEFDETALSKIIFYTITVKIFQSKEFISIELVSH